jgi:hypothetical protein
MHYSQTPLGIIQNKAGRYAWPSEMPFRSPYNPVDVSGKPCVPENMTGTLTSSKPKNPHIEMYGKI